MLASIELCAHGVHYPFYLRTTKYCVIVQPTPDDPSLSPEQIAASRRAAYEAVVAAYAAASRASIAADAAELAAGQLPF
jgi:hypothetical protein